MIRIIVDILGLTLIGLLCFIGYYTIKHGSLPFKLTIGEDDEDEEENGDEEELIESKPYNPYNSALKEKILHKDFYH